MLFIRDNTRKRFAICVGAMSIAQQLGPFKILEREKTKGVRIISIDGLFWMTVKVGQKIILYPMKALKRTP